MEMMLIEHEPTSKKTILENNTNSRSYSILLRREETLEGRERLPSLLLKSKMHSSAVLFCTFNMYPLHISIPFNIHLLSHKDFHSINLKDIIFH